MTSPSPLVRSIDLNADLGEYTGTSGASHDDAILELISSANVACGVHAGDLAVMQRTVDAAVVRGVAIGAHPSYPDRAGFGRRTVEISPAELAAVVISQVGALATCCENAGTRLRYVKPHGALYNGAAQDAALARVIAEAIAAVDPSLALLGLAGSALVREGRSAGLTIAQEAFADRAYLPNGYLLSRDRAGSVLHDPSEVAKRAVAMVRDGYVITVDGVRLRVNADSVCIHGDNAAALELVQATRSALETAGFTIAPFAR